MADLSAESLPGFVSSNPEVYTTTTTSVTTNQRRNKRARKASTMVIHVPGPQEGAPMAFIDFFPACEDQGSTRHKPKWEKFDVIVDRANMWLQRNPGYEVLNCESLEKKVTLTENEQLTIKPNESIYYESAKRGQTLVRGLRLWYKPKDDPRSAAQQIGHLNIMPVCKHEGSYMHYPEFESFGDTISRLNKLLLQNPLPGRILTIETQDIKYHGKWSDNVLDPDESSWYESAKHKKLFLFIIRLFYTFGAPMKEQIGVADFVPEVLSTDGKHPKFESFKKTLAKASEWCQSQNNVKVVNSQTLEIKMYKELWKGPLVIDTQKSFFIESSKKTTWYIRVFRLSYTIPTVIKFKPSVPVQLSYKTFIPCQLSQGEGVISKFESQQETLDRLIAWLNVTGSHVIGSETIEVRINPGALVKKEPERSFTYDSASKADFYLSVLRIYINGSYEEPPEHLLPAVPKVFTKSSTCSLL